MQESPESLMDRAEKKLRGGLFSFFSGDTKYDEASELYIQAANQYKLQKSWSNATQCFSKAAQLQSKMGDNSQEATYYLEAAKSTKKYSLHASEEYYSKAFKIYWKQGRFNQCAKIMKEQAEDFFDDGQIQKAALFFKDAAKYYEMDEFGTSNHRTCILKYADIISLYESKLEEAIEIYETQGKLALKNKLLQYSAKEQFFKSALIYLAKGDITDAKIAIDRYQAIDSRVAQSSEIIFLKELSNAIELDEIDEFSHIIEQFDRIHKLDDWSIHFLYSVKDTLQKRINNHPVDSSGNLDLS